MRMRFVIHIHELLNAGLCVALRGGERDVAKQLLNRAQIRAIGEQVRGEGVAERMGMKVPIDVGEARIFFNNRANGARPETVSIVI